VLPDLTTPSALQNGIASGTLTFDSLLGVTTTDASVLAFTFTAESGVNGLLFDGMFAPEEFPSESFVNIAAQFTNLHRFLLNMCKSGGVKLNYISLYGVTLWTIYLHNGSRAFFIK
jgi:hypothetical protein